MSDTQDNRRPRERQEQERRLFAAAEREAAELVGMGSASLPPPDSFAGYQIIREIHRGGQGTQRRLCVGRAQGPMKHDYAARLR